MEGQQLMAAFAYPLLVYSSLCDAIYSRPCRHPRSLTERLRYERQGNICFLFSLSLSHPFILDILFASNDKYRYQPGLLSLEFSLRKKKFYTAIELDFIPYAINLLFNRIIQVSNCFDYR